MSLLLERVRDHATARSDAIALQDEAVSLRYAALPALIDGAAVQLDGRRVGLLMDNSSAWAIADLALLQRGALCVPVPPFFSAAQVAHLLDDAGVDLLLGSDADTLRTLVGGDRHVDSVRIGERPLFRARRRVTAAPSLPPGTAKVTYTSGTTGRPRGVCLTATTMERVAITLARAATASPADRSLSLLPLSTLLENLGGVYAPLFSGSTATVPALSSCGFTGSSSVRPDQLIATFHQFAPTSTILVPQLLKLLVEALAAGAVLPPTLRFVALGGAPCSEALISRAWSCDLPVYEGYGLSEACSVVSLNRPGEIRVGSTGRPLPHVRVRIGDDGEIVVAGDLFAGYLGDAGGVPHEWHTGDLGFIDDAGYLHLSGRKKTAYATAFGRNVAPEWVESELVGSAAVAQAAVFGEGRAINVALLVPSPRATRAQIEAAVATANARLPDYARVAAWAPLGEPFTRANGLLCGSGALDRDAVAHRHAALLEKLYASEVELVRS